MIKMPVVLLSMFLFSCQGNQQIVQDIETNKKLIQEKQQQDDRLYKATQHNPVPFGEVFNRRVTLKMEIDSLKSLNDSLQRKLTR
jgi:hypothetical protein